MIVYIVLAYTLLDFAWDIYKSRREMREARAERSTLALLMLLHKLGVKSAGPQLDLAYHRHIMRDPFAAVRKGLLKRI